MALDVYVGSLTRYYRREWENVVQRMSRERGLKYTMIHAGGQPPAPPDAATIQESVRNWCDALTQGLGSNLSSPIQWTESAESPYYTDRPAWQGYNGLLLLAAYDEHRDLKRPEFLPESWVDDPAFVRSTESNRGGMYGSILRPEVWLPVDFEFVFDGPTLSSEKSSIGSTFSLLRQLKRLSERTNDVLNAAPSTPIAPPPSPPPQKQGLLARLLKRPSVPPQPAKPSEQGEPLLDAARHGLTVFTELATRACEARLPMLLSF